MQIHIHKDGKNYGPYPLEQVRQYLKAIPSGDLLLNLLTLNQRGAWIGG
jgi:hypothetical protein